MKDGERPPRAGEIFRNPALANTLRLLAEKGKKGFYEGHVAEALAKVVQDCGGYISLEDLKKHGEIGSQKTEPLSVRFRGQQVGEREDGPPQDGMDDATGEGVDVWEHAPNGQGLIVLMALAIVEELQRTGRIRKFAQSDQNSVDHLHAVIESLRIALGDGLWWIADPDKAKVAVDGLLSSAYLAERAKLFDPNHASPQPGHGTPALASSDTVYFAVTDAAGNACSVVNSNFAGFGTAIVPKGCGFPLQNRGAGFVLEPADHPNLYAPGKRPFHTIIPAMVTYPDGSLYAALGVKGGAVQPQGQLQVLLNLLAFGMTPQAALDSPRLCIGAGTPEEGRVLGPTVYVEEGIPEEVMQGLKARGHEIEVVSGAARGLFGRGQIIRCHTDEGQLVYSAGSDPRGDGAAIPV